MKANKPTSVPQLRFPEFRNAPGWLKIPLSDAFKTITNGHANAQDHQDDGAYPLFDRSEVVKRSPNYLFDTEAVILPGEGMRFQPRYFNGKFNLHQRAYALMEPTIDSRFAFHALDRFKGVLADSAVQSTVLSLRMPIIEMFAIPCPTNNDEQQKIADCLGSLDDLITAEGRKLETLRQHKQGLMQQIFPQFGETVPKLRFLEFCSDPVFSEEGMDNVCLTETSGPTHWQYVRVGELCHVARGGSPRPIRDFLTEDTQGINWVKIGDAPVGGRYIDSTQEKIIPEGITRSRFVEPGSFLLSNSMSFGHPYILRTSGCIHDGWIVLEPDFSRVNKEYLYYILVSNHTYMNFERLTAGSAVKNLNITLVKQVEIPLPHLKEQWRISNSLGLLDDLIEAEGRKLEALRQHKQGLMQQLFPSPNVGGE